MDRETRDRCKAAEKEALVERTLLVEKPDTHLGSRARNVSASGSRARTARLDRLRGSEGESAGRMVTFTRQIVMVAGIAVVIRALSRRVDHPLHLPASLEESLAEPLGPGGLTLFSAPDAISALDSVDDDILANDADAREV